MGETPGAFSPAPRFDPRVLSVSGVRIDIDRDYQWPDEFTSIDSWPTVASPPSTPVLGCEVDTDFNDNDSAVNFVAAIFNDAIERAAINDGARLLHPSNLRRDVGQHPGLGVHPSEGKRGRLSDRGGRAVRRRLSVLGGDMAGPRLQWGSERESSLDAGQGSAGPLRLRPEGDGGSVARMADRPTVRIVRGES